MIRSRSSAVANWGQKKQVSPMQASWQGLQNGLSTKLFIMEIPAFATICEHQAWCVSGFMFERCRDVVHTTSSPPSVRTTSETIFSTCFSLLTSATTQCVRRPREATSFAVICSMSSCDGMSLSAISKPSVARRRAMARPMPWLAPVTRATPVVIVISLGGGEDGDSGAKRGLDGKCQLSCHRATFIFRSVGET